MSFRILADEALQSCRALLRRPRYLLLASITLALGVAATTAVFSLLYQSLLRPLPFAEPERLVTIGAELEEGQQIASPAIYRATREVSGLAASGIASAYTRTFTVAVHDIPVVASVMSVDRGFLEALGVRMAMGRNFLPEEDRADGPRVAILHSAFWRREFGGSADALNRIFTIEGREYRAVGVLPDDYLWPDTFDLMVPMRLAPDATDLDGNQIAIARLKPGIGIDAVSTESQQLTLRLVESLKAEMPPEAYDFLMATRYGARPLDRLYRGDTGRTIWMFFAAACCVLLIALVNLTNLVLLRGITRGHDRAVRQALGASPMRLALPAFTETALIGLLGGGFGVLLAQLGLGTLRSAVPPHWMNGVALSLSPMVIAMGVTCGLASAWAAAMIGQFRARGEHKLLGELLGGSRSGLSRHAGWLGRSLVVAQVALATVLLCVAGLFMRDLYSKSSIPMGFSSEGIATFKLSPLRSEYPDISAVTRQTDDILTRLRETPGVGKATASSNLPTGSQLNLPVTLSDGKLIQPQFRTVQPDYFGIFDIPLLAGRALTDKDDSGSEPVCVVSRSFADTHFGGDALGKTLRIGRPGPENSLPDMRIVGVVGDVRHVGPVEAGVPTLYVPLRQLPSALWPTIREYSALYYAVEIAGKASSLDSVLRKAVVDVSPTQPISEIRSMRAILDETMAQSRLQSMLVGLFAALALGLAAIGLYALLSMTVAARNHEYGVRMALGARPSDLLRLVLKDSAIQIGVGLVLGLGIALALSRQIAGFITGISPGDPATLAAVTALLLGAGLSASLAPALRSMRTDPMQALRVE